MEEEETEPSRAGQTANGTARGNERKSEKKHLFPKGNARHHPRENIDNRLFFAFPLLPSSQGSTSVFRKRPPSPKRSCGERYHDADMTDGVTDVATEGAMDGAMDGAKLDSALSMLARAVDSPTSVESEAASSSSTSSVLAMLTS